MATTVDPHAPEAGPDGGRGLPELGETPLTDLPSLAGSAVVHALLLGLLSLTVLTASAPTPAGSRPALRAEIEPADTRADRPRVAGEGGGSPGAIGGLGTLPPATPAAPGDPGANRDPAADAILAEILPPPPAPPSESTVPDLPGPQTTGIGQLPGSGPGGGGGSGGGSGSGVGRGIGPGTEFFGARDNALSFAYVIDCSGSMATRSSLDVAKRELLASLDQLPPDASFSVIFYNLHARILTDPQGRRALMSATAANKARVRAQLGPIAPDGGTDHMLALRTALAMKPEVIFFLTDADLMSNGDVDEILSIASRGRNRIQAVEFGRGSDLGQATPLRRLAGATGGTYRYVDVSKFPRNASGF